MRIERFSHFASSISLVALSAFIATVSAASLPTSVFYTASCTPNGDPWADYLSPQLTQCTVAISNNEEHNLTGLVAGTLTYSSDIDRDGWDKLSVYMNTNTTLPLEVQYYGMGYLEGFATFDKIFDFSVALFETSFGDFSDLNNASSGDGATFWSFGDMYAPTDVKKWIADNLEQVESYANSTTQPTAPPPPYAGYQEALRHLLLQMRGMADGYMDGCKAANATAWHNGASPPRCANPNVMLNVLPRATMYAMNYRNEVGDVWNAFRSTWRNLPATPLYNNYLNTKSASVLVTATASDLYVAHVSYDAYQIGLRKQYKTYNFMGVGEPQAASQSPTNIFVSMSSYPGMISSQDDWYMTGNGLAVTSSPLVNNDNNLTAKYLLGIGNNVGIPSFLRTMIANYYATNGPSWLSTFSFAPSNTYSAEWLVADMKLFSESDASTAGLLGNSVLPPNVLLIIEAIPGQIISSDGTSTLYGGSGNNNVNSDPTNGEGFWAAYSIPAYQESIASTLTNTLAASYGAYFSAAQNPIGQMLSRNATDAQNLQGIAKVMRYNQYSTDPLSIIQNCISANISFNNTCIPRYSSSQAIGARGDLNPHQNQTQNNNNNNVINFGPLSALLGYRLYGAVDVKISSYSGMMQSIVQQNAYNATRPNAFVANVVSGPPSSPTLTSTHEILSPLPIFDWLGDVVPHPGLPSSFNFSYLSIASFPSVMPTPTPINNNEDEPNETDLIIVGLVGGVIVLLVIIGLTIYSHRKKVRADAEHQIQFQKRMLAEAEKISEEGSVDEETAIKKRLICDKEYGAV